MRVQFENKSFKVHYEDEFHYYVKKSNDEPINGYLKQNFEIVGKFQQRPEKLKRIFEQVSEKKETFLFDYDWNNASVKVEWSGGYPNLCSGEWQVLINDMVLPIPEYYLSNDMGTAGIYSSWHFDDNYSEVFENYTDGLGFMKWLKANQWLEYSLKNLAEFYSLKLEYNQNFLINIFNKINEGDWRSGSCGGCI